MILTAVRLFVGHVNKLKINCLVLLTPFQYLTFTGVFDKMASPIKAVSAHALRIMLLKQNVLPRWPYYSNITHEQHMIASVLVA